MGLCETVATPKRSASRSVATRRCISPCPHSTTSCASGIVHDRDRRVLLEQLVQRLAELDVVLALLGGDRDRQHRRIGRDLGERRVRLLAGGEGVAGIGVVELAERDRLAGRAQARAFRCSGR